VRCGWPALGGLRPGAVQPPSVPVQSGHCQMQVSSFAPSCGSYFFESQDTAKRNGHAQENAREKHKNRACINPPVSFTVRSGRRSARGGWRLCRKLQFFAHLQADQRDKGDAGKDWTDGVQKSDVCCTGFSASTTGLHSAGFLRCSSGRSVAFLDRRYRPLSL
jgi:hypothetical protein